MQHCNHQIKHRGVANTTLEGREGETNQTKSGADMPQILTFKSGFASNTGAQKTKPNSLEEGGNQTQGRSQYKGITGKL